MIKCGQKIVTDNMGKLYTNIDLCSPVGWHYFKTSYDVIKVTMATGQLHRKDP